MYKHDWIILQEEWEADDTQEAKYKALCDTHDPLKTRNKTMAVNVRA